jgi:hypothetical protein
MENKKPMDNELCKCGKVGKISCPNDERCGSTQLPADIETKIFNCLLNHSLANRTSAAKELAELFATEYATKLQHEQRLVEAYRKDHKINSDLLDTAFTLLENFISRHEAGLLPDRGIYEEIKTFLDKSK